MAIDELFGSYDGPRSYLRLCETPLQVSLDPNYSSFKKIKRFEPPKYDKTTEHQIQERSVQHIEAVHAHESYSPRIRLRRSSLKPIDPLSLKL